MACNSPIYHCLTKLWKYLGWEEYVIKQRVGHLFHISITLIKQFLMVVLKNPFWVAIKLLWEIFYPTNPTERLATPLWLNKEILVHDSKGNLLSGYRSLYGIVDVNGHLLSKYNVEKKHFHVISLNIMF